MKIVGIFGAALTTCAALITSQLNAQQVQSLSEYLESVNYAYVTFEGEINYDRHEDKFLFKFDRDFFGAVLDAGREAREAIQSSCERKSTFDMKWCTIAGEGTVEVRGSDIWLSIEKVVTLN